MTSQDAPQKNSKFLDSDSDDDSEVITDAETLVDQHELRVSTFHSHQNRDLVHLKNVINTHFPMTHHLPNKPLRRVQQELFNFLECKDMHSNISIAPIEKDIVSKLYP